MEKADYSTVLYCCTVYFKISFKKSNFYLIDFCILGFLKICMKLALKKFVIRNKQFPFWNNMIISMMKCYIAIIIVDIMIFYIFQIKYVLYFLSMLSCLKKSIRNLLRWKNFKNLKLKLILENKKRLSVKNM